QPRRFLSGRAGPGHWAWTSGSTGIPLKVYWGTEAAREALCCQYRHSAMWGVDIFDRVGFLWGDSSSLAPGVAGWLAHLRQPLLDWLRSRVRLSAYPLGPADLRRYLRRLAAVRPAALYGYSQAVELLARAAGEGFRCPSLRLVRLTSEPAP